MNSGLYFRAGVSATARAAACANRLDGPITKVSKVYRGLMSCTGASAPAMGCGVGGATIHWGSGSLGAISRASSTLAAPISVSASRTSDR